MTLLNRRRFLTNGLKFASALELQRAARALGFAAQSTVCTLQPEQEVGPYYVADELLRADIREGKPGLPLTLHIAVLDSRTCKPLNGAAIDIWHCDALGIYSGYTKTDPSGPSGFGGPGGPGGFGGPPSGRPGGPPGFEPQGNDTDPQHSDPDHPNNRPGPPEGFGPPPETIRLTR